MKRCPKCNKVFEDSKSFCLEDGTELVIESFPLPSELSEDDEEKTVVRMKPSFDIPAQHDAPTASAPVAHHQAALQTAPRKSGCLKYFLILLLGLILGGAGVLAAVAIGFLYLSPSIERTGSPPEATKKPEPTASKKPKTSNHNVRNSGIDESRLNGRVIARSAVVRSLPQRSSRRIAVIPRGDRLNIIRRRSPTSAWYRVECEHGASGWMHGNTIAYDD